MLFNARCASTNAARSYLQNINKSLYYVVCTRSRTAKITYWEKTIFSRFICINICLDLATPVTREETPDNTDQLL